MAEVIGVRFKEVGKIYYFDPEENKYIQGDRVVVETARGIECGTVALANKEVEDDKIVHPLKKVIRQATKADIQHIEENKIKEEKAFEICQNKIREHNLDMKLVEVEYTFDNSKILFYFTADGRVDFRTLVKDLATIFRTRIELRQIGVRDEAKMLGGLGVCGKPFCCNSFLGEFQPVSIKMAKKQGLSLSPVKISGTCGRLMCCLKYEQDAYTDLIKNSPKVGDRIDTPEGKGTVVDIALLTGVVKVKMDDTPEEAAPHIFSLREMNEPKKCPHCKNGKNQEIDEDSLFDGIEFPTKPQHKKPKSQKVKPVREKTSKPKPVEGNNQNNSQNNHNKQGNKNHRYSKNPHHRPRRNNSHNGGNNQRNKQADNSNK